MLPIINKLFTDIVLISVFASLLAGAYTLIDYDMPQIIMSVRSAFRRSDRYAPRHARR